MAKQAGGAESPQTVTYEQLDSVLAAAHRASSPARVFKLTLPVLQAMLGQRAVTAFAYDPSGEASLVEEGSLPADLQGKLVYPPITPDETKPNLPPINEWCADRAITKVASALGSKNVRLFPLQAAGDVLGGIVIFAHNDQPYELPASANILLREIAHMLLELKLSQSTRNSQAENRAMQRITQAITSSLEFDKVVDTLLTHTRRLFKVDAVSLVLIDPNTNDLYIYRAQGLSDAYVKALRIPESNPRIRQLIRHPMPGQIANVKKNAFFNRVNMIAEEGIASMLFAPIITSKEIVGALVLYSKTPRHFVASELRFSQNLAEQASIAFANANLHAGLQKISNEIEQTRNLMQDGLLVLDLEQRLRYVNAAGRDLLRLGDQSLQQRFTAALVGKAAGATLSDDQLTQALQSVKNGEPGRTNFAAAAPDGHAAYYEAVYSPYRDYNGQLIGTLINIRDITMLYREKEKLATIQANMLDGLVLVDTQGRASESNNEWASLFGVNEVLGTEVFRELASRDDVVFDRNLDDLLADALQGKRLTCYGRFTNEQRHIQISIGPVQALGVISGAVATARDITPLIDKTVEANSMAAKAQRHLRELSQLAELSSIIGFNLSGIYEKYLSKIANLLASPEVAIYLYQPASQKLINQRSTSTAYPDELSLEDGHPVAQSFSNRRGIVGTETATGLHLLAMPIIHHSKTLGVILVGRPDLTYGDHEAKLVRLVATRLSVLIENSNLYHDVNARRERWEAVFRFTEDGIVIFDREGSIVGFNPASTEITHWPMAEAVGQPFERILKTVTPDTAVATPLARVLGEGITIAKSEQLLETRVGGRLWTEISYSPIFDEAGRVTSGIAIIRNTQKDREIEEIKSDFISIVSHELRTPLTAIKGFLSMVLKEDFGPLAGKQAHYLGRVYQSNQRMIDLVEDLLDVSYIESGKINLSISPVAMEGIITEVINELSPKAETGEIKIRMKRRQRLPQVLADESRLHQIVLNLVDNAIKYSMPGTSVEIDGTVEDDQLIITVTDHGVGINKSQLDRLFTKFGRIYNPMSVQAGGSGLGLYIVKNLVESHGGRIWVTSQEGKGSKFRFSVPLAKQLPLLA